MPRVVRPNTGTSLGNHEERIRRLERSPGGGGGSVSGELLALWYGLNLPLATGAAGGVWSVPYVGGSSVTWNIARAKFRLETPSTSGGYTIEIQRSPGGSVFTPTNIISLSLAAGAHEVEVTSGFGVTTVTSGQLLRVFWQVLGSNAQNFTVQLEASS